MKKLLVLFTGLIASILLPAGCETDDCPQKDNGSGKPADTAGIYTARTMYAMNGKDIAVIWKDGERFYRRNSEGVQRAGIYSTAVDREDIYVVGYQSRPDAGGTFVWKNEQKLYILSDGIHRANVYAVAIR